MVTVVCPTCFEEFDVMPPSLSELPAEWDYDCEVCCRPMFISFEEDDESMEGVSAYARGLGE